MNARVEKPRTLSSRWYLSKPALERPAAVLRECAGRSSPSRQQAAESEEQSAEGEDQSAQSDVQPTECEDQPTECEDQSTECEGLAGILMENLVQPIHQPKSLPVKRPYTSFLTDSVDQPSSGPTPKKHRPECVDRFVTQWVESVSGSETLRERNCRSDSLLNYSEGEIISRRLTKSALSMGNERNAGGFIKPTTPASATSRSNTHSVMPSDAASSAADASTTQSSKSKKKKLVEDQNYRYNNLASNNIFMRYRDEEFPEHINDLIDRVSRDRDSPGPPADSVWRNRDLQNLDRGAPESDVQGYFHENIFSRSVGTLQCSDKMPMARHSVPDVGSIFKVSTPWPDLLYGYNRDYAFPHQEVQARYLAKDMTANTQNLVYPFFVIEFKGDSTSGSGSWWVATNQCLGGSASCVKLTERLNDHLRQFKSDEVRPINSAAFSIAMSGTEARLYISWKDDELKYYLQHVRTFAIQDPIHYLEFRKYVRNIFDWGKDQRLTEIRDSLDPLLEETRKRTSAAAKSRPSPSNNDSASNSSRKRKS